MKIFKFSASWCEPCKAYAPIFDKTVENLTEYTVERVDVEKNPEIAGIHKVMSIPCTIILNNAWSEIFREVGVINNLEELIEKLK